MKDSYIRVIDTGLKGAAENIAWNRALMSMRGKNQIPNTIRFLRYTPSALVGYHQVVADEIRVDYCRANGIEINRRITGGGAIYFDEGQLGWELVFEKSTIKCGQTMGEISSTICETAARALRNLGVNAYFRPRNDLEVDGRKISGTGGTFENNVVLFQGTLLVDFDLERLIKALRIPVEKLTDKEIMSTRERVASINEILGRPLSLELIKNELARAFSGMFGASPKHEEPMADEYKAAEKQIKITKTSQWINPGRWSGSGTMETIHSLYKSKGGILRASGRFDLDKARLKQLLITGDIFVSPKRTLYDIEAVLKDCRVSQVIPVLKRFLDSYRFDGVVVTDDDFVASVTKLIEKFHNLECGMAAEEVNAIETLSGTLPEIANKAEVMLVPYCAKPYDCQFRNTDSCDQCGKCTVGDAYMMAKKAGMRVISINNYENLVNVLGKERQRGTKSFIGTCCSAFFTKRHKAFTDSGMSCAIIDIDDTTCYDLNEEDLAYKGEFKGQTHLKLDLLKKILSLHPRTEKKRC